MAGPHNYDLNIYDEVNADGGEMGNIITYDLSAGNQYYLGEKVINVTDDSEETRLIFKNDVKNQLGYSTDGDDLVINIFGVVKDYSGSHVDTSKIIGTVRITDGATDYFDGETRMLFLCGDNNFWDEDSTSPTWYCSCSKKVA